METLRTQLNILDIHILFIYFLIDLINLKLLVSFAGSLKITPLQKQPHYAYR